MAREASEVTAKSEIKLDQTEAGPVTSGTLPLVVDMDGFLVRADVEAEAAVAELEAKLRAFAAILRGQRPAPQASIDAASIAEYARKGLDVSRLPLQSDLVDYIHAEASNGRELHLITSASQEIAEAIAAHVGSFTSATGACIDRPMTSSDKLRHARQVFPSGFAYAGRDQSLIRHASTAVVATDDIAASGKIPGHTVRIEAEIGSPAASLASTARLWIKALRCHQWSKNALVFIPLILGHAFTDPVAVASCIAGFFLLSVLASGTYLLNDLLDLDADRRHPTKSRRPLARGDIRAGTAIIVACVAISASLAAAYTLSLTFFAALTVYLITTLSYSFYLKRLHLVDVFVLAALFTTRIAMGIALAGVTPSPWLLTFTMFFFLSLSLAKRHVEIVNAAEIGQIDIPGRDYRASDLPLTVALGISSNAVAMLVIFLYLAFDAMPTGFYSQPYWLWGAGFVVFLWSLRIWGLSHRGKLDADPVAFAIKDRPSIALGLVVLAVFGLAL